MPPPACCRRPSPPAPSVHFVIQKVFEKTKEATFDRIFHRPIGLTHSNLCVVPAMFLSRVLLAKSAPRALNFCLFKLNPSFLLFSPAAGQKCFQVFVESADYAAINPCAKLAFTCITTIKALISQPPPTALEKIERLKKDFIESRVFVGKNLCQDSALLAELETKRKAIEAKAQSGSTHNVSVKVRPRGSSSTIPSRAGRVPAVHQSVQGFSGARAVGRLPEEVRPHAAPEHALTAGAAPCLPATASGSTSSSTPKSAHAAFLPHPSDLPTR